MNSDKILELAFYTLPALITGGVAYTFFNSYFKDQQNTRRWLLQKENQKEALPIKLQAYERLTLLLERMHPTKLVIRVAPVTNDKFDYANLLIQNVEQEYEHNLTQQIYVSNEAWTMILTAKNTIIQTIRKTSLLETIEIADKLREVILTDLLESEAPSAIALNYLKSEVNSIF